MSGLISSWDCWIDFAVTIEFLQHALNRQLCVVGMIFQLIPCSSAGYQELEGPKYLVTLDCEIIIEIYLTSEIIS